jgi:hypothetical protein
MNEFPSGQISAVNPNAFIPHGLSAVTKNNVLTPFALDSEGRIRHVMEHSEPKLPALGVAVARAIVGMNAIIVGAKLSETGELATIRNNLNDALKGST